jgi:hypothetical protein
MFICTYSVKANYALRELAAVNNFGKQLTSQSGLLHRCPKRIARVLYSRAKCEARCTKHRHDPELKRLSIRLPGWASAASFLKPRPLCLPFPTTPRGCKRSSLHPPIRFLTNGGADVILPVVNSFPFLANQGNL